MKMNGLYGLGLWSSVALFALSVQSFAAHADDGVLELSNGDGVQVKIEYGRSTYQGNKSSSVSAVIQKILITDETGRRLDTASFELDRDLGTLVGHDSRRSAEFHQDLICEGSVCSADLSALPEHLREFEIYFATAYDGSFSYLWYGRITVNEEVLQDPWAPSDRRDAFQLNFVR